MAIPHLLIIEDDRPIAFLLSQLAAETGATTDVAYDGRQGLAMMRRRRPDMLLLDLIMPIVSGETVLSEMSADPKLSDIPVLIIATKEVGNDVLKTDLPVLHKPFAPADVKRLISQTVG